VANQTVGGEPLIRKLKELSEERPHRFIVVCPQGAGTAGDAHERLAHTLKVLQDAGLEAIGQVTHPDPYTAVQTAIQFYNPDEIVISTFPETRSGWLREHLVERVSESTSKPVHHVVVEGEEVGA
jgi:GABA permease